MSLSHGAILENLLVANALAVVVALWLDRWLGEPSKFHPLVGYGNVVVALEKRCRRMTFLNAFQQGVLAWALAVVPLVATVLALCIVILMNFVTDSENARLSLVYWFAFNTAVLYLTIGGKSLIEHAESIYRPLSENNIEEARRQVGMIVSRNTEKMTEKDISSSTIESVLENGNDAVFAPIFWFVLFAAPGAVLLRAANTLDAMWGYKNQRYLAFGRFAARSDDVLGWLPARITGVIYALQGNFNKAIHCWNTQAKECSSPNGGVVMTSGAGALNITIGGPTYYHGILHDKKPMGVGEIAHWSSIPRANQLVTRGSFYLSYVWLVVVLI